MAGDSAYVKVHTDEFLSCISSKEIFSTWTANVTASEKCGQKLLQDAQAADVSPDTRKDLIRTATAANHAQVTANDRVPLLNAVVKNDGEITKFQLQIPGYDNRVNPTKEIDLK